MTSIDIQSIQDDFFLHYGGEKNFIDGEVFTKSLQEIINIIKEINYQIHPEENVIVCVEALHQGSFRPKIVLKRINNVTDKLASKATEYLPTKSETIATFCTVLMLAQTQCSPNSEQVTIEDDRIIIQNSNIYIDTATSIAALKAIKNKNIQKSIAETFSAIERSPTIESFGIVESQDSKEFITHIPRTEFKGLMGIDDIEIEETKKTKTTTERNVELKLNKIALNKRETNWEVIWNGHKIHTPIIDPNFWNRFENHDIEIGHGDTINADLIIHKVYDPIAKIYIDERYEIDNILSHNKANKQYTMFKTEANTQP